MATQETKKDVSTTIEAGKLIIEFCNGKSLTILPNDLAKEMREMAELHGLKQKLIDAAAISRNPETGKSATVADKYAAVKEVFDRITGPDPSWNKTREGSGPRYGLLLTALTRLYPDKSVDELKEFLEGKSKAEQAALRLNSKISSIIDEIKLERVGDIDIDGLLDELE